MPNPASMRHQWTFPEGVIYLNHGSFGPAPRVVQQVRQEWFERLESQPMDFLARQLEPALLAAVESLAQLVGTRAENLAFVDNATAAMNALAANFPLSPGDEVVLGDHEYGAVRRLWQRVCDRVGARLVVPEIAVPVVDAEQIKSAITAAVTPRTKLLVVSHLTSPTALIFPVERLCDFAQQQGLAICIDGPHALATLPLDLDALGCDYYTASCHKWLSAPFGSGFLYVHPRHQASIGPAVWSWGGWPDATSDWRKEFHWAGTRDPAPWLSVPRAIEFLSEIGWETFRNTTHAMARYARERISQFTGLAPLSPDSPEWYGPMVAMPLPPGETRPLQQALWERYRIEVPIVAWQGRRLIRVSCHLYTQAEEIDRLVGALGELRHEFGLR